MKQIGPVLVTGAGTGIGRAISETLASNKCTVYAAARKDAHLNELAEIDGVDPVKLDVTNQKEIDSAVGYIRRKRKGLYGLVNCAGIADIWPLIGSSKQDLARLFDVNVFGVHRLTKAALPLLVEARGRIVNIGSLAGVASARPMGAYCMTKFAIEAYSEVLAAELERYGVKVAIIEPGDYRTNLIDPAASYVGERERARRCDLVHDEEKVAMQWLEETTRNFSKRQGPQPVAQAAVLALSAPKPRFRYSVAPTSNQFEWALNGLAVRLVQTNEGGGDNALSKTQLHELLDRAWARS